MNWILPFMRGDKLAQALIAFLGSLALLPVAIAGEATIAVASNFKPVMETLEQEFEATYDHDLTVVFGSSGKLFAQIRQGAPFDVFLSADQMRPETLAEAGLAQTGSQFTYALGRLVLWDPQAETLDLMALYDQGLAHIALANPDLAPYGLAALQVLDALELDAELRPKLVFGENVSQAFTFVHTGNAQLGFVSYAQLLTLEEHRRGAYWETATLHDPIRQDTVLLGRAKNNRAAQDFLDFLKSEQARTLIEAAGYKTP